MRISKLLAIILLVTSCGERRFPRPDFENIDFKTTEQAKMFFKNVRSYYYESDLYSFKGAEIYRWADRHKDSTRLWINPVLVIHFLQDKAFILTELSPALKSSCKPFLYCTSQTQMDSISLEPTAMEEHFELNVFIYDAIETDSQFFFISKDGKRIPFLTEEKRRGDYHKQMRDFLRLVGAI